METVDLLLNILGNVCTVIATVLAIYIYVKNKDKIKSAIDVLLNYSYQISISDLKSKIDRLNEYTVNDPAQKIQVINILHEIEGQINGNKTLKVSLSEQIEKISIYTNTIKLLTEPKKRSLISELREKVRTMDVSNINEIIKSKSEK